MNEWEWQVLEEKTALDRLEIGGIEVRPGSRVRLRPRAGGDIMDLALAGQIATVECIEQDYEGKSHVCVVLDDDPGKDMGLLRQPGHRFFFAAEEIVPLSAEEAFAYAAPAKPSILVAGIGNIFLGDDAFGVEVVRRMARLQLPSSVRVSDFGIRGFDLAYALQDGYATTILIDACPRGDAPGTLYVMDLTKEALGANSASASPSDREPTAEKADYAASATLDAHTMNPMNVLAMARAMNVQPKNILLVGCEPQNLGGEQGEMGLSPPVEAAVDQAVKVVESLIHQTLDGEEGRSL